MSTETVDRIMKKVEEHYRGVFTVNNDNQLSSELYQKIRLSQQNTFYGYNGLFKISSMSSNEHCIRFDNTIELPENGIVYGPYLRLFPGKYRATFNLKAGQETKFSVDVYVPGKGIIAEKKIDTSQDSVSLEFDIDAITENVEFRVFNFSKETLSFYNVTLVEKQERASANAVSATTIPQHVLTGINKLPELDALFRYDMLIQTDIECASKASSCTMPAKTRFLLIKKIIRKLMNVYTAFQIDFNYRITGITRHLFGKLNTMANVIKNLHMAVTTNQKEVQELQTQFTQLSEAVEQIQKYKSEKIERLSLLEQNSVVDVEQLEMEKNKLLDKIEYLKTEHRKLLEMIQNSERFKQQSLKPIEENIMRVQKTDENLAKEINSLWEKIRHQDIEFNNQWNLNSEINKNLSSLWSAYQTFRQEIFYELNFRLRSTNSSRIHNMHETKVTIKPSAIEKIKQSNGKVRLNLGSGSQEIEGYINVDARDLPNVDVIADLSNLPYEDATVDEIFSSHVIEHFTFSQLQKELLPYWYSLLKPNGVFRAIFPDFEAMLPDYQSGEISFDQLARVVMGGQDYMLDYHYSLLASEKVMEMLQEAGFKDVKIIELGRKNDICRESEIIAIK